MSLKVPKEFSVEEKRRGWMSQLTVDILEASSMWLRGRMGEQKLWACGFGYSLRKDFMKSRSFPEQGKGCPVGVTAPGKPGESACLL